MKRRYSTLRDGDTIDYLNKAAADAGLTTGGVGNFVMRSAGNSASAEDIAKQAKNYMDGTGIGTGAKPPVAPSTTDGTMDSMKKHAVPVAVGGATTLGLKYGLKKKWGMSLAGGLVAGAATHFIKDKMNENKTI